MKEVKIKVITNMTLYTSKDGWLHLETVIFKVENDIIYGTNTDHLWRWKSSLSDVKEKIYDFPYLSYHDD